MLAAVLDLAEGLAWAGAMAGAAILLLALPIFLAAALLELPSRLKCKRK